MDNTKKLKIFLFTVFIAGLNFSIALSYIMLGMLVLFLAAESFLGKSSLKFTRTPFEAVFVAFIAVFLLSAFLGVDLRNSMTKFRSEFIFLIFYMVYFSLDAEESGRFIKTYIGFSAAAAIFGIFQYVIPKTGIASVFSLEAVPSGIYKYLTLWADRAKGTRSHPITYAECLFFGFVLSAGFFFAAESIKKRMLMLSSAAVHGIAILFTYTRGVWLGSIAALVLLSVLFASGDSGKKSFRSGKESAGRLTPRLRAILFAAAAAAVIAGVFLLIPKFGERMFSRNEISRKSNEVRVCLWQSGAKIFIDYPVLGVGPRNVRRVYPKYQLENIPDKRIWTELHCMYLQILAERGSVGFGVFLWLLAVAGASLIKFAKKSQDPFESALSKSMLACFAGFLIFNLTENAYNDTEVQKIFYFLMGCIFSVFLKKRPGAKIEES